MQSRGIPRAYNRMRPQPAVQRKGKAAPGTAALLRKPTDEVADKKSRPFGRCHLGCNHYGIDGYKQIAGIVDQRERRGLRLTRPKARGHGRPTSSGLHSGLSENMHVGPGIALPLIFIVVVEHGVRSLDAFRNFTDRPCQLP